MREMMRVQIILFLFYKSVHQLDLVGSSERAIGLRLPFMTDLPSAGNGVIRSSEVRSTRRSIQRLRCSTVK